MCSTQFSYNNLLIQRKEVFRTTDLILIVLLTLIFINLPSYSQGLITGSSTMGTELELKPSQSINIGEITGNQVLNFPFLTLDGKNNIVKLDIQGFATEMNLSDGSQRIEADLRIFKIIGGSDGASASDRHWVGIKGTIGSYSILLELDFDPRMMNAITGSIGRELSETPYRISFKNRTTGYKKTLVESATNDLTKPKVPASPRSSFTKEKILSDLDDVSPNIATNIANRIQRLGRNYGASAPDLSIYHYESLPYELKKVQDHILLKEFGVRWKQLNRSAKSQYNDLLERKGVLSENNLIIKISKSNSEYRKLGSIAETGQTRRIRDVNKSAKKFRGMIKSFSKNKAESTKKSKSEKKTKTKKGKSDNSALIGVALLGGIIVYAVIESNAEEERDGGLDFNNNNNNGGGSGGGSNGGGGDKTANLIVEFDPPQTTAGQTAEIIVRETNGVGVTLKTWADSYNGQITDFSLVTNSMGGSNYVPSNGSVRFGNSSQGIGATIYQVGRTMWVQVSGVDDNGNNVNARSTLICVDSTSRFSENSPGINNPNIINYSYNYKLSEDLYGKISIGQSEFGAREYSISLNREINNFTYSLSYQNQNDFRNSSYSSRPAFSVKYNNDRILDSAFTFDFGMNNIYQISEYDNKKRKDFANSTFLSFSSNPIEVLSNLYFKSVIRGTQYFYGRTYQSTVISPVLRTYYKFTDDISAIMDYNKVFAKSTFINRFETTGDYSQLGLSFDKDRFAFKLSTFYNLLRQEISSYNCYYRINFNQTLSYSFGYSRYPYLNNRIFTAHQTKIMLFNNLSFNIAFNTPQNTIQIALDHVW